MQSMTLEQLRATASAGGVKGVTLKGQGGGFFVEIATRSGQDAFLAKARSTEPRRFGNPSSALIVLRNVGIVVAQLDATLVVVNNAIEAGTESLWAKLNAVALPVIVLVLVVLAHMMRMTRAAILNVMQSAYIETAELKGLRPFTIIARHAFPNAIAPVVNVVMLNLAYLVVGVVVVVVGVLLEGFFVNLRLVHLHFSEDDVGVFSAFGVGGLEDFWILDDEDETVSSFD